LPQGVLLDANEIQPHRAQLVRDALTPFGDAVTVSVADGVTWCDSHEGTYDRILVDAPCTGLGALRRRPESRWRKFESDLDDLVPLQQRLLDGALRALKVGGVVAYVTCSPHPSETVDVIADVVSRRPGVEAIDTSEVMLRVAPALRDAARGSAVQLYPHRHHTDAMFIQLIRRTR
jgi:16S rRNA (cytosine967-C5)-methyltransferase